MKTIILNTKEIVPDEGKSDSLHKTILFDTILKTLIEEDIVVFKNEFGEIPVKYINEALDMIKEHNPKIELNFQTSGLFFDKFKKAPKNHSTSNKGIKYIGKDYIDILNSLKITVNYFPKDFNIQKLKELYLLDPFNKTSYGEEVILEENNIIYELRKIFNPIRNPYQAGAKLNIVLNLVLTKKEIDEDFIFSNALKWFLGLALKRKVNARLNIIGYPEIISKQDIFNEKLSTLLLSFPNLENTRII